MVRRDDYSVYRKATRFAHPVSADSKNPVGVRRFTSPKHELDDIVANRTPYWVIVHLGISGALGDSMGADHSTSHSPAPPEIYLEQVWHRECKWRLHGTVVNLDGRILIMGSDILALEFFEYNQM